MRDDDEIGHYVPLLRRIIILVAVITAVPVVLWTITAFVRTYVGPPKIPTFHQLAAKASINEPLDIKPPNAGNPPEAPIKQAKLADPSPATATDARGDAPEPKGPLLAERTPENDANPPATNTVTPAATPVASAPKAADPWPPTTMTPAASAPKAADDPWPPAPAPATAASADTPPPSMMIAGQPPTSDPAADDMPAAAPLTGAIPLPRRRPHIVDEPPATATTSPPAGTQVASASPTGPIPMPRPRPDTAGPGAPAPDTSSGGPLGFITNMFGSSK
jgi:hypothetical protein